MIYLQEVLTRIHKCVPIEKMERRLSLLFKEQVQKMYVFTVQRTETKKMRSSLFKEQRQVILRWILGFLCNHVVPYGHVSNIQERQSLNLTSSVSLDAIIK